MLSPMSSKRKKKPDSVAAVIAKVTGREAPYRHLLVTELEPNDWNPNRLDDESRIKLTKGMKRLLNAGVPLPPVVVRPHPARKGSFQIIDGYHRWDILRTEGYEKVDAYVLDVDTATAMILTDTLNYLRGTPDQDAHAEYLHRLLNDTHMPVPEAAEYLPYTETEIREYLDAYGLDIVEVGPPPSDLEPSDPIIDDKFLILKFSVSREQAEIIEREIARVSNLLDGKNLRGRALEFMAVNSSQTEPGNLTGEPEQPPSFAPTGSKKKKKREAVGVH